MPELAEYVKFLEYLRARYRATTEMGYGILTKQQLLEAKDSRYKISATTKDEYKEFEKAFVKEGGDLEFLVAESTSNCKLIANEEYLRFCEETAEEIKESSQETLMSQHQAILGYMDATILSEYFEPLHASALEMGYAIVNKAYARGSAPTKEEYDKFVDAFIKHRGNLEYVLPLEYSIKCLQSKLPTLDHVRERNREISRNRK